MIIGIDCGYRTGGVALVGDDWAEVHDLPTYSEGGVDVLALMDIIKSVEKVDHIYIERQQAMPRQGVVSTLLNFVKYPRCARIKDSISSLCC